MIALVSLGDAAFLVVCALIAYALVWGLNRWAKGKRAIVADRLRPEREPFIDLAAERERLEVALKRRAEDLDLRRTA